MYIYKGESFDVVYFLYSYNRESSAFILTDADWLFRGVAFWVVKQKENVCLDESRS